MFIESFCLSILQNKLIPEGELRACEVYEFCPMWTTLPSLCVAENSIYETVNAVNRFHKYMGSAVNWQKVSGFVMENGGLRLAYIKIPTR